MTKQELLEAAGALIDERDIHLDPATVANVSMKRLCGLIEAPTELAPGDKLKRAMELSSLGLKMKRQSLRRDFPEASKPEIQQHFESWLYRRDAAPIGDCPGSQRRAQ